MCGACHHVAADPRVAGPQRREAAAAAVTALTGLAVRPAIGVWTVASPTGRQQVCSSLEELAATASDLSGVSSHRIAEAALDAAADQGR
ncbi:hypothetical protein [Aeromicrobium sp. Leaf272]|uniref:hypothetical protein n=1 Tax=Aeromicrobium sp. Leaf272 TaxID=1736317 RepID=UPI0006FCA03E|nr:hypothetical protein [Aeromicrobium sp. Leaf272]KQP27820.1 hypothetical protein ASF38_03025 [Aeromicrobium sp. Leaf272]